MDVKDLRYKVMLALYFPILLYAFSTFDLSEDTFIVDELQPVVVGPQTVVLGQPFQARTFLAMEAGQGQQLEGQGTLESVGDSLFQMQTATLLAPDEHEKTVSYDGTFRYQALGGATEEIPVRGQFRVQRPEIVATSEATQTLYRATLNRIRIEVPGLDNRVLRLVSGGREVEARTIAISPSGEQSQVEVFLADSDVYIGEKTFAVIDPPLPQIRVLNAGREVSNGDNVPKKRALLEFKVEPDAEFKRQYPEDATYRVGSATIFVRRGLTASEELGSVQLDNNKLVLTRLLRDTQPGDRLLIRIDQVVRVNHAGQTIPVEFSEGSLSFGFTIS